MNKSFRAFAVASVFGVVISLSGCIQMPTERSGVADLRPQISFSTVNENLYASRVSVDGMDVGVVGDFVSGRAALHVLPGNHRIVVVGNGAVLLDEKTYMGDGASRSFQIQ